MASACSGSIYYDYTSWMRLSCNFCMFVCPIFEYLYIEVYLDLLRTQNIHLEIVFIINLYKFKYIVNFLFTCCSFTYFCILFKYKSDVFYKYFWQFFNCNVWFMFGNYIIFFHFSISQLLSLSYGTLKNSNLDSTNLKLFLIS